MFSVFKGKTGFESKRHQKSKTDFPVTVEQRPGHSQPADKARTPSTIPHSDGVDHDRLCLIDTHVDGLWLCCCGAENELVHWTGLHPFKYLKCEKCGHVLCGNCETTHILTLWEQDPRVVVHGSELRMAQVCPSCGLSHRA
ncbi:hypothetical protein C7974DRAFT_323133, partial [Boeremia exigua]|uniref:uncharacterized protein n=1 Tax=Boeremia exigua TaxID=749465 RepID=UPI001E8DE44F